MFSTNLLSQSIFTKENLFKSVRRLLWNLHFSTIIKKQKTIAGYYSVPGHNLDSSPTGVFLEANVAKFLSLVQSKDGLQDPVEIRTYNQSLKKHDEYNNQLAEGNGIPFFLPHLTIYEA